MRTRSMIAGAVLICALAAGARPASAQTGPFTATYTEKFLPSHGNPKRCPDEAFACGSGTATGLGAFTTEKTFDEICGCVLRTLTFSDGSTLVLEEDFVSFTPRGGSASSNAPPTSEGHPGTFVFSWTIDGGTGSLAGATGGGTDVLISAGLQGTGTLAGTITTP